MFIYVLTGCILSTLGFSLYITFSPKMKGITFRTDDQNNIRFTPKNLLRLMVAPYFEPQLWKPNMWDINYFVWLFGGLSSSLLLSTLLTQYDQSLGGGKS